MFRTNITNAASFNYEGIINFSINLYTIFRKTQIVCKSQLAFVCVLLLRATDRTTDIEESRNCYFLRGKVTVF